MSPTSPPGQQTDNTAPFRGLLQEIREVPASLRRLLLHRGSLVAAVKGGQAGSTQRLLTPAAPPSDLTFSVSGADQSVGNLPDTVNSRFLQ